MGAKKQRKLLEKRLRRLAASADEAAGRAEKAAAKATKERKRAKAERRRATAATASGAPSGTGAEPAPDTAALPAGSTQGELESSTKVELLELARAAGVPGRSAMSKAELVAALRQ